MIVQITNFNRIPNLFQFSALHSKGLESVGMIFSESPTGIKCGKLSFGVKTLPSSVKLLRSEMFRHIPIINKEFVDPILTERTLFSVKSVGDELRE
jgi:hypothetical protein